ncbi:unnamed protein product [Diabrotica balteata]|uniref:Uncharacterized protein n=1 Tax=Diabrotica balteata TaxID=107213 RepID=A0A9N9T6L7_DIABA|nr:unnamed protein product [Diabrotica balteata]
MSSIEESSESETYQDSGSEYVPTDDEIELHVTENTSMTSKQFKPKKQVRKTKTWQRNSNKFKRCSGMEYKTKLNKTVKVKTFNAVDCSCKLKCTSLISHDRPKRFAYTFLLSAYVRRKKTRIYILPNENGEDQKVCKYFFQAELQKFAGRLDRLLKNKAVGAPPPSDRRGKHPPANKTTTERETQVKLFIQKIPSYKSHYCREKGSHRKYLSPDLSMGKLYMLYKTETVNPVSHYIFGRIFNTQSNLHFHPPISDSCKKCDIFNIKLKAANEEQKI